MKGFFNEINGVNQNQNVSPEANEARTFWSSIWDNPAVHNDQAEWLNEVKMELKVDVDDMQNDLVIDERMLKKQLRKTPNWKAPGPDGVQGFWYKHLYFLHSKIAEHLNAIIQTGQTPEWLTTGRTVLCIKDPAKGNVADNYRPISCLPVLWKVLTAMLTRRLARKADVPVARMIA